MINICTRINESGVPILSAESIDRYATRMVEEFLPCGTEVPVAIDIDRFLTEYAELELEEELLSHDGHRLGMFIFEATDELPIWCEERQRAEERSVKARTVLIDSRRQTEEGVRFTKAHECGHALFHNHVYHRRPELLMLRENGSTMSRFERRNTESWTEIHWMDWQANNFASCLLMPRPMVEKVAEEVREQEAFDAITFREARIAKIRDVFQVSSAMAEIRLNKLGLLEYHSDGYRSNIPEIEERRTISFHSANAYRDGLGRRIPEQPLDPPEPKTKKRRSNKLSPKERRLMVLTLEDILSGKYLQYI